MIEGVRIKELITHSDERGFVRELIRVNDDFFTEGFGQWNHSVLHTGVVKAWHIHQRQVDWWYVGGGVLKLVLYDTRKHSPTLGQIMEFQLGDNRSSCVARIPPGVAHGCRCLSGPAHLFYVTSQVYDSEDEGRIPHDDPKIGYDWLRGPPIK